MDQKGKTLRKVSEKKMGIKKKFLAYEDEIVYSIRNLSLFLFTSSVSLIEIRIYWN